jgi:hypothetical protein
MGWQRAFEPDRCQTVAVSDEAIPFDRWGRVTTQSAGSYVLVERETSDGWKVPPPADAVRIWMRQPGAADDDDYHNWTTWIREGQLADWISAYEVVEWLPLGVEPSWT